MLEVLVLAVFPGLVMLAGTSDLFTMTIPNKLCLALVAAFFIAVPFAGMPFAELGWHVAAAFGAFAVCFLLFAGGVMGGGDAKLTAAVMLWLGPAHALDFLLVSAILGGLLTLGILMMRTPATAIAAARVPWAARLVAKETGIPYGIALSAAAIVVLPQTTWFQAAIGF
ncbi:MAG: prepilin peptidase [Pseudomonadota bacterium]